MLTCLITWFTWVETFNLIELEKGTKKEDINSDCEENYQS